MAPLSSPVTATYLPPTVPLAKLINLNDLCQRIIAEWQYNDHKTVMPLVKFEDIALEKAADGSNLNVADLGLREFQQCISFAKGGEPMTNEFKAALTAYIRDQVKGVSKISMRDDSLSIMKLKDGDLVLTVKEFKNLGPDKISDKELHDIYWRVRMRGSAAALNHIVGRMGKELKRLGYQGYLLPDGSKVTFDSLNYLLMEIIPKKITLIHFEMGIARNSSEVVEWPSRVDKDGLFSQHVCLCFKLPKTGDLPERCMIVDPTFSKFGIYGPKGEMVYWNYFKDYLVKFHEDAAHKIGILGFEKCDAQDKLVSYPTGPAMVKKALKNFNSPICSYCGEIEGRKIHKGMVVSLKKCARCKKVAYCDGICQKLGWVKHKTECKNMI